MYTWRLLPFVLSLFTSFVKGDSLVDNFDSSISRCAKFKYEFANLTAIASSCFIKSSQPLRICQNCRHDFKVLEEQYDALVKNEIGKTEKVNCQNNLLQSDASSAIIDLSTSLSVEWNGVNCDNCYQNGNFTSDFTEFLNKEDAVMSCFQVFTNASLNYSSATFETLWIPSDYFNGSACNSCNQLYHDLNSYYTGIHDKIGQPKLFYGGVCGDMGDIMNTTRYLWSKKFSCDQLDPDFILIIPICLVVVLLLMFYCIVSTYFHNHIKTVFYKQRRMRAFFDEEQIRSSQSAMLHSMN